MAALCFIFSPSWTLPPCLDAECLRRQDRPGQWHSQEGQDRHIMAIFSGKRNGYFVDCAANEPVQISNTRSLERDFGWSGLCVEPNQRYWSALRRIRSCKLSTTPVSNVEESSIMTERGAFSSFVAKSRRQYTQAIRMNATALSRAGLMQVRTRRIDSLLREHGAPHTIDYLSLDVEVRRTCRRVRYRHMCTCHECTPSRRRHAHSPFPRRSSHGCHAT